MGIVVFVFVGDGFGWVFDISDIGAGELQAFLDELWQFMEQQFFLVLIVLHLFFEIY